MFRKITKSTYFKAAEALTISGILIVIISNWLGKTNFGDAFAKINDTLTPLYIGVILSFLLCPLYNKLVRWTYKMQIDNSSRYFGKIGNVRLRSKKEGGDEKISTEKHALKLAKVYASFICLVLVFGIITILGYVLLPQLFDSVMGLINTLPQRTDTFAEWVAIHFSRYPSLVEMVDNLANVGTTEVIAWVQEHLLKTDFLGIAEMISNSLISVGSVLIDAFVGILIAVYILNYKENLLAIARKIVAATCSDYKAKNLSEFAGIINETFIGFIVGRILDAGIIWLLTYLVMLVIGMPQAILISSIVGITNIIPFFGPFIGAVPSVVILLLEDPMQALYFIIMIIVIQQLDGNFIGPRIVGSAIGLNSFWVLLAVLIGGGLFGFIGMALGVPVFAVCYKYADKIVISRLRKKDKDTKTIDYVDLDKYDIDVKDIIGDENRQ